MKPANFKGFDVKSAKSRRAARTRRACIQREIQLVSKYWFETIHPHTKNRELPFVEWYVATDAYRRIERQMKEVQAWNESDIGKRYPVSAETIAEILRDGSSKPKALRASDKLTPEILAQIAAPLLNGRAIRLLNNGKPIRNPADAISIAKDLLIAAQSYTAKLPKNPEFYAEFSVGSNPVTFDEILRSSEREGLRLLPPVQAGRNEGKLTPMAITTAVRGYSQQRKLRFDWRSKQISMGDLCSLRWDRFERFCNKQKERVRKRERLTKNQ